MSDTKLIVTKDKLDKLATSIATKAGVASPLTIAQMKIAVDNLVCGTITQDENGYLIISENGTAGDLVERFSMDDIIAHNYSGVLNLTNPEITTLYPYQFAGATNITEVNASYITEFNDGFNNGVGVFRGCTNLVSVSLPNLVNMQSGGYQFANCTKLVNVYMPLCATGQHMFDTCTSLENIVFGQDKPSGNKMNSYAFYKCTKLKKVDIGNITEISTNEFNSCTVFNTLILRRSSAITTLANINAFSGSPFASGKSGGTLYVPSALISSYESATNWSTILGYPNNSIQAIEGSIYETQYADGTPISS